jgi:hypothetical protein
MKSVVILLLLVFTSYSQPLKYNENSSIEGCYIVFYGAEFFLNNEGYSIVSKSGEISGIALAGKKIFIISKNHSYLAIASFAFSSDKRDYPVTIDVYNNLFEPARYTFLAPYDYPHGSLSLTDMGEVILFDPLTYRIEIFSTEGKKEYSLEKSVDFEMERSFYTDVDKNNFYLLISERPLSPEEDGENVFFYSADLSFASVGKRSVDIDIPVGLYNHSGNLFLSGIGYNKGDFLTKTFIISDEGIKEAAYAFEKLEQYNDGYAAKFGSILYLLDKDLSPVYEHDFGNHIADIAVTEAGVAVLVREANWRIYNIGEQMEIDKNIILNYPGGGNPPKFGYTEDTLLLHTEDSTFIFNDFVRRRK